MNGSRYCKAAAELPSRFATGAKRLQVCTQQAGHAGQRPCKGQNQHGADHGLEALGDAGSKVLKVITAAPGKIQR